LDDEERVNAGVGVQPTFTMGLHVDLFGIELEASSVGQPLVAEGPLEAEGMIDRVTEERDNLVRVPVRVFLQTLLSILGPV
jgi:hypothetical protein